MRMLGAVALSSEFTDPRLLAVYDALNAYGSGTQPEFYLRLAREADATTVVELGCGTGLVAVEFARDGFDVIALEPSEQMLEVLAAGAAGTTCAGFPAACPRMTSAALTWCSWPATSLSSSSPTMNGVRSSCPAVSFS